MQVELSLTEPAGRLKPDQLSRPGQDGLAQWSATVATAAEPCLILDSDYAIVAVSWAGCELTGLGDPTSARGQLFLDVIVLLDFADGARLDHTEAHKTPPILAIRSQRLARGLMRVATASTTRQITLDAIATPLSDGADIAGSLTFFAEI